MDVSLELDEFTINTHINQLTGVNREYCHCLCMDDVVKPVKFNSDIRLIITPVKLWIMKGNKTYGLTYKVNKIDVQATTQETIDFID